MFLRQPKRQRRINCVDRHANRHRFAMPQGKLAQHFQLMRTPVAKIQRPRFEHLKRIAAARDVIQVQLGRATNDRQAHFHFAPPDPRRQPAHVVKQRRILQQRNLHRLDESANKIAIRQALQQRGVVDHAPRHGKRADPILLLK